MWTADETNDSDNPHLQVALKAYSMLTKEQRMVLSKTLEGFLNCLAPAPTAPHPNPHARTVITEAAWENRANWGRDEWNAWETWGWYKQFCRAYAPYLRTYVNTLETVSFGRFNGVDDAAGVMLRRVWNVATGQE